MKIKFSVIRVKNYVKASFAYFFLVQISLIFITSCSSIKKINRDLNKDFLSSATFQQGFSGFAIYDPEKAEYIYTHNAHKYFTPASNIKLLTFYTGLKMLGDSIPAIKYGITNDSVIFTGTGDPSFLNPDLPGSDIFHFFESSNKKLFYHPSLYAEKIFGPGWSWDDYNADYSVERTAFPIYGNRVTFSFQKGDEIPEISPAYFKDSLKTEADPFKKTSEIIRDIAKNEFTYQNFIRPKPEELMIPFKFSGKLITELMSDTLKKEVKLIKKLPENFYYKKTLYSVPADSIYKTMLQVSDNFIAEQILLMAANTISDSLKTAIAIDYMKEKYLSDLPDEIYWADGSGLSRYNLTTPRSMIKLLEKIKNEVPMEKLLGMLAVGGKSGTLKNYYKATEPYIYAKTGTLRNNHSISGYLKAKSGKILIFSFMNSNYTVPTKDLKEGMEKILKLVRDRY